MKSKITKEQIISLMKDDLLLKDLADKLDISQAWTIKLIKHYGLEYNFKKNKGSNPYWKGKNISDETKRKISESKTGKVGKRKLERKNINCPVCDKEYEIVVGSKNRSLNSKYCSRQCADKAHSLLMKEKFNNKEKEYIICDNCGKKFYKPKSLVHDNNFCDVNCFTEYKTGLSYDDKYGIRKSEEIKTKIMVKAIDNNLNMPTVTKPHIVLKDAMIDKGLYNGFETSKRLYYFEADELNKDLKLVIEVDGDYWHANPEIYGDGLKPINEQQEGKQIADKRKNTFLKKKGYTVIRFWESDIYNNIDRCMNIIEESINAQVKK